jgi:hypothetical protein
VAAISAHIKNALYKLVSTPLKFDSPVKGVIPSEAEGSAFFSPATDSFHQLRSTAVLLLMNIVARERNADPSTSLRSAQDDTI